MGLIMRKQHAAYYSDTITVMRFELLIFSSMSNNAFSINLDTRFSYYDSI